MTPRRRRSSISSEDRPASAKTSSVCSPRRGAALAAAPLSLSRIAGPGPIARPSISTTEWRRQADGIAPARLLDLHYVGAEVGQEQRAVVAGQEAREVDDPDPLERQAHPGGSTRTSSSSTVSSPAIEKW